MIGPWKRVAARWNAARIRPTQAGLISSDERRVVSPDEAEALGLLENPLPLDGVYRERARLVALLAALYPSTLVLGADPEEPDWAVLFITLPTGQASWHIAADDLSLFHHVDLDDANTPGAPEWDGHSTAEKYERIAAHVRTLKPTVPVPRDALRGLVEVARWVSGDPHELALRSTCTDYCCPDGACKLDIYRAAHPSPRPDAKARRALAALDDAGLLDQLGEDGDG
ncbi:hypothetical protein [Streptomyces atriruber]|uniref:WDGH domain-containing protein n=1 Tax=Streptomyces atriruber TaxID=545121 RepID=UPI0006E3D741|nr:hypothetical protein [Streptomyces atriruber]